MVDSLGLGVMTLGFTRTLVKETRNTIVSLSKSKKV